MNDSEEPSVNERFDNEETLGNKVVANTPWAMIAIMIHVLFFAIMGLWFVAKAYQTKEEVVTEMKVAAPVEKIEDIKPPEIVDREQLPKLQEIGRAHV